MTQKWLLSICGLLTCCLMACDAEIETIGDDPYAGGREPLGIGLAKRAPSPSAAYPGDEVTFSAQGLLQWATPDQNHYDFEFFIADEKAEIKMATDTTVTIVVPDNVSSGITHILLQGQVFFGPNLNVLGNVTRDQEWGLKSGTSGPIFNYLEHNTQARNYYLLGGFDTVENQLRTKLAYVSDRGILADLVSSRYNVRRPLSLSFGGIGGIPIRRQETLSSMSYFSDGQVLLSGTFNQYELTNGNTPTYTAVNNITILNNDIKLDTMVAQVLPAWGSSATTRPVARFNGGTLQPIIRSFVTQDDKIIAIGNITTYAQADYDQSTSLQDVYTYETIASAIRMERNGDLDTEYRSGNPTGATGITDGYLDNQDRVVIVGEFTTFDGVSANRIVCLGTNGLVDQSYMNNIGTGANGPINMVRYNKQLNKAVVVGNFTTFNGEPRNGIAVLNEDGTLDETFVSRDIVGGRINFATILNSGKIVISGTFKRYDNIARPGFLILDNDGASTQRFNVPGAFVGQLYQAVETQTTTGRNGLLLMGSFSRFNGERVNNVVMLEVDFDE